MIKQPQITIKVSFALTGFPGGSAGKESACNEEDLGSIPGLGKSPGEGTSCPLQYSGLENSMDYTVYGITKNQTQLSEFHFALTNPHTHPHYLPHILLEFDAYIFFLKYFLDLDF